MTPYFALAVTGSRITGIDWLVIAAYFGILLCVATWVVRKGKDSSTDYFLAGRNLGWWVIGASIFASNIGSEHVVGLAGQGATSGVAMAHYELHAWALLLLGWVFVPFYMRSKVFTMPEFLERRFNHKVRLVYAIISLIGYIVIELAVVLYTGSLAIHSIFGLPLAAGLAILCVIGGGYAIYGGFKSVAYTDIIR